MGAEERFVKPIPPEVRERTVPLDGTFAWNLQGFMEAQFPVLPETRNPQPVPPDGHRNPPAIAAYRPPDNTTIGSYGQYPYSEAGYFVFSPDGTFTGVFRLNIGGSSGPFDKSRPTQGRYTLFPNGTGRIELTDPQGTIHLQCFVLMVDDNEALLHVDWVNTAAADALGRLLGLNRSTGTGWMKRMR
ncbi:MAG: hypothetical protein L0170_19130 [Acidobacteria bacterium]|nr:hypothetical protein [Acidobacteriota bacterium]